MSLADLTKDFIGKEYDLGKMDCFRLVYDYLKRKILLPEEFNGINLESYADLFIKDPISANNLMISFLQKHLNELSPEKMSPGDIAVLSYKHRAVFLGIITGNANVLIVTESEGVVIVPLKHYKLMRIFRCPVSSLS